jgi:hypothetical protein
LQIKILRKTVPESGFAGSLEKAFRNSPLSGQKNVPATIPAQQTVFALFPVVIQDKARARYTLNG